MAGDGMGRALPKSNGKAGRKARRRPKRPRSTTQGQNLAERSRIWQALLESEDRYRATFDCAPVGILHSSVDSDRILHANPKLIEMLGYSESELLGMTTDDILHPDHAGADRPRYREQMLAGELESFSSERKYVRKNGSLVWVNRTVSVVRDAHGKPLYFIRIMEDISGRRQAEANLERMLHARRVMAECNRVLIHAVEEVAMLEDLCRVVVESGSYKMAWVGLATGDARQPVRAAAHAGFGGDSPVPGSGVRGMDRRYQEIMGEVIATGQPHIARDILNDPARARRRARSEPHGFQSSIALPLKSEGRVLGAVAIYAREPEAFDVEEISLLFGLADDMAFGIVSVRERVARQNAEAARLETEQRLSLALEGSGQALFDWNIVTGEVFLSPRWNEILGGARAPALTTIEALARLVHPDDLEKQRAGIVESLKHDTLYRAEHRVRNRTGEWIWIQSHGKVTARDAQGRALRMVGYNADITPHKLAALALAASEERFRATFEQAAVGIAHVNLDGVLLSVNQRFCDMLGYGRDELMGREVKDFTHPDDYGQGMQYREMLTRHAMGSASGEKRFLRKDGAILWARRTMSTASDASGKPQYVISIVEDITERKAAEDERKQLESRFRDTFEQAAVGIFHADLNGRYLRVNRKLCEITGYTEEELTGPSRPNLSYPDDLDSGSADRKRLLAGEITSHSNEKRYVRKDGKVIWVNRTESLARDEAGNPLYLIRVIEEVTERKELQQRFRETFDQAAVGIVHSGLDGRYLRVNRKFCEMLGYDESEIVGHSAAEFTHPDDPNRGLESRQLLWEGTLDKFNEVKRYQRKDGSDLWANRTVSLARDASGKPLYFIRVVEDITERRRAESESKRSLSLLQATLDSTADGILVVDGHGRVTSYNQRFLDLWRIPDGLAEARDDERLIEYVLAQLTDPDRFIAKVRELYLQPAESSKDILAFRDGRLYERYSRPQILDGEIVGRVWSFRDITESKRAEDAVVHERVLLRTIIDTVPEYIYVKDAQGRFLLANRSWLNVRGSTHDNVAGKTVFDFFPRKIAEKMAAQDAAIVNTGIPLLEQEQRIILSNPGGGQNESESRWAAITKVPMRDPSGKIIGTVGVSRDITERKRAEEAIARERALLRTVVDAMPDRVYAKDTAGRFLLQNLVNAKAHGFNSPDELLGKTAYDLFPREVAERVEAEDRSIVESGAPLVERERGSIDAAGNVHWVASTKVPLRDAAGKTFGLVGMTRDITDRKLSALRREMEHAVTKVISEAASVDEAMPNLLGTICRSMNWAYGARWTCDDVKGLLRADYWADFEPEFHPEDRELWVRQGPEGSMVLLHRAWRESEPTWVVDIDQRSAFRRQASARKFGLHSAFAFPIVAGGRVIGVMEFFGREVRQPDEMLLQGVRSIGSQIGQFIQRKEAEQALRTSEERYRDVFDASPLPMWVWNDETLDIVAVNQAATAHYGYSRDEFLRMNVRDLWAPGEQARYEGNLRDRTRQQALSLQRRHRTKDGRVIDTEVTARLFTLGGRPVWLTVVNDVSVRVRAEAALRESEEQFRQLAGNIPQVFWITDTSHQQTLYVSPAAETMLGRPLPDILADRRALIKAVHKEDRARVYAARRAAVESGYDQTFRITRADGSNRWVHDRAFPVRDGEGRIYRIAGIAEDVTDRKHAEERLEHLAHYDTLTNLPNRALFYDRLRQALAQARRNRWTMGVMFLDADRFKNVNDTLGHAVGDQLLQQIAERLTRSVRSDDTVGRLGGDEFAIVLSTLASAQDATLVAQKIMAAFKEPFKLEGAEVYVTASVGITLYPDDSSDQDVLVTNADAAMYRAKEIGRNSYQFYTPKMNARAVELLGMESALRRALERDEFLLYYQPKASVTDGNITGLEALLRWKHPERGLVSPGDFIPLLEETGLIVQVGEWVLEAVCSQVKAWERAGIRPVPVSVNLSARQFAARDLGETIKRILAGHQVDPALIEFEITESSLMQNIAEAVRTLEYLDQLGVGLSIDDFGTGYSSLGYLKRFPLSAIKIDRSFVRDVTSDGDDATITRAVISMAHNLGLKVIAEGVETRAQLEFLAEYGCNEIQGYYFARPMTAAECSTWISEQRRLDRPSPASDTSVPVVLILDDDDDTLGHVERVLARDGYRILAARNAREGLALLRDHRVDVVVSDQNMPGMSGVEFLQCVQTLSPRTIRILATGFADFQTMADAVNKGGIFRCLPKDIGDDALRDNVRAAVLARIQALEKSLSPSLPGK